MAMMRIAVAGTGGLAVLIARAIQADTTHPVVFLSRTPRPNLAAEGFQVAPVDYQVMHTLQFALRGIDTVISTVSGPNQIELIRAAISVRVRRFIPSEFEGVLQTQAANTPSDQFRLCARNMLQQYGNRIQSTIFVCGIFYEWFQPGGLAASNIGLSSGVSQQGGYMVDFQNMTAEMPVISADESRVTICMTAAADVARFVTRALDMPAWPPELFMRGRRVAVANLLQEIQALRQQQFRWTRRVRPTDIHQDLQVAAQQHNVQLQMRFHRLLNTAEGRYDYQHMHLNLVNPDLITMDFNTWFAGVWNL